MDLGSIDENFDAVMDFRLALEAFKGFEFVVIVADAELSGVDEADGFRKGSGLVVFDCDLVIVELGGLFGLHKKGT